MKTTISLKRTLMLTIILALLLFPLANKNDALRYDFHHKKSTQEIEQYRLILIQMSEGGLGNPDIPLGFRNFPKDSTIAGTCNFSLKNMQHEIDINPNIWQYYTGYEKVFLLAHEFLHACGKMHNNDVFVEDGCPTTLIYPYVTSYECIINRLDYYRELLKKGCD
jgi:hypothetical protein